WDARSHPARWRQTARPATRRRQEWCSLASSVRLIEKGGADQPPVGLSGRPQTKIGLPVARGPTVDRDRLARVDAVTPTATPHQHDRGIGFAAPFDMLALLIDNVDHEQSVWIGEAKGFHSSFQRNDRFAVEINGKVMMSFRRRSGKDRKAGSEYQGWPVH